MKLLKPYVVAFVIAFAACNLEQNSKAYIFERKQRDSNKLMIKYRFIVNNKEFVDSSVIENRVIDKDTITVSYDNNSPENSTPQLNK